MIPRLAFVLFAGFFCVPSVHGQTRTDSLGDPLPRGAIARLGTLRFKHDPGRSAGVAKAAYSPDGKRIASLGKNGTLRLWDAATGKELPGPWSTVSRCAAFCFSPDSTTLAADFWLSGVGYASKSLALWNIAEAKSMKTLSFETVLVVVDDPKIKLSSDISTRSLAFTADGKTLFAAQTDGSVRSWDIVTGKETRVFMPLDGKLKPPQGADDKVATLPLNFSFSPGAKYLAAIVTSLKTSNVGGKKVATSTDTEVITLDLSGVKEPWRIEGKLLNMNLAFSADNKRIAIAVGPNKVELRDTLTGKMIASPPLDPMYSRTDTISGLALSSDGNTMAIGGRDFHVTLWNLNEPGKFRKIIAEPTNWTTTQCLAFAPDNKTLLVGAGSAIQLYDVATLKEINPWEGHRGAVEYLAFSPDGKRLLTGGDRSNLHFNEVATWDVASWKRLQFSSTRAPKWPNIGVTSPEHTYYIGRNEDDRFALYDFADGKLVARFSVPAGQNPNAVGFFSPGSKFYLLEGEDTDKKELLSVYALPSGRLVGSFRPGPFGTSTLSPDGFLIAMTGIDGRIHVIDTATGKVRHGVSQTQRTINGALIKFKPVLGFSLDGKLLAARVGIDDPIEIWDMSTGKEWLRLPTSLSGRITISWSPDGRQLAACGHKIELWELATNKVRREFKGHLSDISALGFSPDGRLLASGSADTTVLIWDLLNGDSGGSPVTALKPRDLENHWQTLAADDAAKAFAAICNLTAAPKETVVWIKDKLKPAALVEAKHLDDLITQLENDQYKVRQKATAELLQIGERVLPTIEKVLAANPPLETRLRLQELRTKLTGLLLQGERLQAYRAVEVLEHIGSREARQLLQSLADGAPGAMLTTQAQGALDRFKKS